MFKVGDLVRYKIGALRGYHTDDKIAVAKAKTPLLVLDVRKGHYKKHPDRGRLFPVQHLTVLHPDGTIAKTIAADVTGRL
tara:strand:+ start:528 stop:767 length:240 start_codon:yes stop_codon:yes gene_type:complete